jgi:hypothetical protein
MTRMTSHSPLVKNINMIDIKIEQNRGNETASDKVKIEEIELTPKVKRAPETIKKRSTSL